LEKRRKEKQKNKQTNKQNKKFGTESDDDVKLTSTPFSADSFL